MQQDLAEEIALKALAWIAADAELLQVFLGSSGASGDDLKARIADPEFLLSVLDFLTMDDAWIVAFCDSVGLNYDLPMQAKGAFPGGSEVNWT